MLSKANDNAGTDPQAFWSTFVLPRIASTRGVLPHDKIGATHARRVLNDELSAMQLAMCALRARYNALAPISTLPAEVLIHIFDLYAAMNPPGSDHLRPLGWIEVTHVCRLWRDTAIQRPSLWSDISFTLGQKWTEEMLRRSRKAPISIHQDVGETSGASLRLIAHHLPRTRELILVGLSFGIEAFLDSLPPPSENLETMEIGPVNMNFEDPHANNYELPEAIAGCHLPSLRRLVLRTFWVPWSASILHNLKHLKVSLHRHRPAPGRLQSSSQLVSALKGMPNLETLSLTDCLPRGPWDGDGSEISELLQLKVLKLEGPPANCFAIVNHLQLPASCQVQLSCTYRSEAASAAEVLPFLKRHVRSDTPGLPPWHTLSVCTWLDCSSELQLWRHSDQLEEEGSLFNPRPPADFEIEFYSLELEQSIRPLKTLCQALPLHTIRTFVAWTMPEFTPQDWIDIVGGCVNVDAAAVSGANGMSFCTALGTTVDGSAISTSEPCEQGRLFLRNLKTLKLSDMEFGSMTHESRRDIPSLLTEWLTDRQRVEGVPAIGIIVRDCDIPETWVECLRLVTSISWDGYEGVYESDSEHSEDGFDGDEQ